ncbi:hypothetical protein [Clostridium sp.]|uniref:hypothetical protein n=1 Tax=Clostridium sp. TaxID=1506 RepID=UPI001A39A405|nr:hypothetical protein [Clostridium sp.]MBK5242141.1 hypothetical protein [Clostridium sp.]
MKLFNIRDKKELIGLILGSVCFLPSFIIAYNVGYITNMALGITVLVISQLLWITSIQLSNWSLDVDNRKLKEEIKKLNS